MTLVLVFVFGLIIGSFLNAVIYRLYSGESVFFERSHCVHCNHELAAIDLIPVISFVLLRGRCGYCGKKISWQYPLVELLTAISFALLAYNLSPITYNLEFGFQLLIICFLIVIGVFDLKHYLILDKVIFPALGLVTVWNIYTGNLVQGLLGALIVSGFFGLQYFISKGMWIGFGDVKFGLLLGSLFGIKLSIAMLFVAYLSGAVIGVTLVLSNRKTLGSKLPFGVFLSFSAIIMLLYGEEITTWYLKLTGLQ